MLKDDIIKNFVNNSPHLKWMEYKTIYMCRAGSHSYGTNIASSDEDFRGICIPPKEYYLGNILNFQQATLKEPDAVVFEIKKFFNLAEQSNPNALEILFVDSSDVFYTNALGEELLANRDIFLSKKVMHTMTGYAFSQLHRIQLHRQWLLNPAEVKPNRADFNLPDHPLIPKDQLQTAMSEVQKEMNKFQFNFMDNLQEDAKIEIRNIVTQMLAELKITAEDHWMAAARKIGFDDNFLDILRREKEFLNKKKNYESYQTWKKERNPVRAAMEAKHGFDCKHGMHLYRLLGQCRELLTTGKFQVKRPDAEFLKSLREGAWSYDQLMEFAEKEQKELQALYQTSTALPYAPDSKKIDKLLVSLIERSWA